MAEPKAATPDEIALREAGFRLIEARKGLRCGCQSRPHKAWQAVGLTRVKLDIPHGNGYFEMKLACDHCGLVLGFLVNPKSLSFEPDPKK